MKPNPLVMEDHFTPRFKISPAVHIGSQTVPFFRNIPEEQAFEGYFLGAASEHDVVIVRNFEESYIRYWKQLAGDHVIINLPNIKPGEYLTQVILEDPKIIEEIKKKMDPKSRLHVFHPTRLEHELAEKLEIPLHGNSKFGEIYGTKSGTRRLADKYGLTMAPGFICKSIKDVENAFNNLKKSFSDVVIKYDISLGGYFNKKVSFSNETKIKELVDEVATGVFHEGADTVVVEGWIKSKATPCADIEILENQEPIISAVWQQLVDESGTTRIGAGPLMISDSAMKSFMSAVKKLALVLKENGAVGSYGPDFLITNEEETHFPIDTAVLLELNARIPITAIPLEIVRNIRGKIGEGFWAMHIKLENPVLFEEIEKRLDQEGLLIRHKDPKAKGVVPFNVGLLPWKTLDVVAMADTWQETQEIMRRAQNVLSQ